MKERKYIVKIVIVIYILTAGLSGWLFVTSTYQENKGEIMQTIERMARELALPYHIAELSLQNPVTELPVPVYNTRLSQISDTWNATRAEGRNHEGVDIFADRGTPVFSATEGYVIRLNIGSQGGKNVMVVGPGGIYYYYAHFNRIAEGIERGVPVTTDTVLGFVGNSGNASSTPPHLHFGIYPEMWEAVNPYPLLINRD